MLDATIFRPDFGDAALAARWTVLAGAGRASPFLSWDWVGCLAAERYADPLLVELRDGGVLAGLALFDRRGGRWGRTVHLHETGRPALDSVFIEHNGIVSAPGREAELLQAVLRAVRGCAGSVVLSGVDDAWLAAARGAGGIIGTVHTRAAPFVRFDGAEFSAGLSRNTRSQLGRSDRAYAAAGPIRAERAETVGTALAWFDALLALHLPVWKARGVASGLATAPVQAFLRALIGRGVPSGTVDLLRVGAGPRTIGYLLNLCSGGRVAAYQSGFDYSGGGQERPGLTCHHAAILRARSAGAAEYDFLAGDARYKRSLGNEVRTLHWFTWHQRASISGGVAAARRLLRR